MVTQVAALHIVCHIATHPWPPEVASDEFSHFPSSWVTRYWVVMVGLHNVESELTVMGDINLASVEY